MTSAYILSVVRSHPGLFAKLSAAMLSLLALTIFDETQFEHARPYVFIVLIGIESLVFVNSISPYAFLSVALAQTLLAQGHYLTLSLGFAAAFGANLLSFYLGTFFSQTEGNASKVGLAGLLLTFWHPQLASIEAFEHGAKGSIFTEYISKALPIAVAYYSVACFVISSLPFNIATNTALIISIALLLAWSGWDLLSARRS